MDRFRDWRLKYKLLATSSLLVVGVTALVLATFAHNLGKLRDQAIPDQRVILSLSSNSYDFLSEIREYALESADRTLEQIAGIEEQLLAHASEYEQLNHGENPEELAIADTIHDRVRELIELGREVVEIEKRLHRTLIAEATSAEMTANDGTPALTALARERHELFSQVRQYVIAPQEETLKTIAALERELTRRRGEAGGSAELLDRQLVTSHAIVDLRQQLGEAFEELEDAEIRLGDELDAGARLAQEAVVDTSRTLFVSVVATGVLGLLLASVLAFWMASRINRSVSDLQTAADRFAAGDLKSRVQVATADELGQLGWSFNRLAEEIATLIANLQHTQAQLIQSGKMVAVGELAAGVAHELNNPLSVVLTYSVLLQEKLDKLPGEVQGQLSVFPERLSLIKTSAQRCKSIVDNLLLFSRQDVTEHARVDPGELLKKTFELIGSQMRHGQVKVDLEVERKLPPLRGNFNQLQQVVTNLALNALQAMTDGGELKIVARRHGAGCELTFTDTGPGIPREHLDRIFEPFFTTKASGKGTGLGLAIAYGIVQDHHGEISVASPPGEGATFRILLPFAATGAEGA